MALVRCPSCGRVADGKMCFACDYEWPADAPATPSPPAVAARSPSQDFKIASPASYPTAAVVARVPTPPPMPPDEIDLDVDFDDRRASEAFPAPSSSSPPAFGAPGPAFPSPSGSFSAGAPAFPSSSGAFGSQPPAFAPPATPPSPAFGTSPPPAFPTPSGSFGAPAFGSSPPPAFPTASGSFGVASFGAPPLAAFPSSPPAPAPDPWGAPAAPELAATPSARPSSMRYPAPDAGVSPSWGSNPTVQVSAAAAGAMMDSLPSTPASLTGLFDGLNQPTARAEPTTVQAPTPPAGDDVVHGAVEDNAEAFNFTLEPGSTVEPEPSPFDAADDSFDVDMSRPASSRSLSVEVADDFGAAPAPPGAGMHLDSGFAEIDPIDLDEALADEPAPPPAFDPFSAPEPVAEPEFAVEDDVPAAAAVVDESSFADVEFSLEAEMAEAEAAPRELDGEAAFDALGSLDDFGELPPGLDDQAGLDALAELDREIASLGASLPPEPVAAMSSPAPVATKGPTLSSRVGALAESLEEGGRIADAAMLYEVQAVLAAAGR